MWKDNPSRWIIDREKYCIANRRNLISMFRLWRRKGILKISKRILWLVIKRIFIFLFLKSQGIGCQRDDFSLAKNISFLGALKEVARNLHFLISTPLIYFNTFYILLKLDILDLSVLHSFELVEQYETTSFILSKNLRSLKRVIRY